MATLALETALTESQMEQVMKLLDKFLTDNSDLLDMVTFEYEVNNIRIEAEFETFLDGVRIQENERFYNGLNAEVFTDYLTLKCDTMVFQQRTQKLLDKINQKSEAFDKAEEQAHRESIMYAYAG